MKKLILDFDDCIVNSTKAYCYSYNHIYQNYPNFISADWTKNDKWDFSIECPLETNSESIFKSELFFNVLEFIPNAKEVIERLCEKYEVIICTIGTHENISNKVLWLKRNLPCVKNIIPIINNGVKMDKSVINMKDSIAFLDDNELNLNSSDCPLSILFNPYHKQVPWNEHWKGTTAYSWLKFEELLNELEQNKNLRDNFNINKNIDTHNLKFNI